MSKYNQEIDYLSVGTDISEEELAEIITEADEIILKNKETPEKIAEAYLKKGQCLQKLGKHLESREHLEKALVLAPTMAEAITQLGNILLDVLDEEKKYDEAIAHYTEAIRLKPDYVAAFDRRGWSYFRKEEYDLAIADYTEAIRLKPAYAAAFDHRGWSYLMKQEYDLAIADYTEVIRLKPAYAAAFDHRGWSYTFKKEYDLAIADYTEAMRLKPDYSADHVQCRIVRTLRYRASRYYGKGDYNKAIDDLSEAIRLVPTIYYQFIERGDLHGEMGEYEKAIADYTKAIQLIPEPNKSSSNPFRALMAHLTRRNISSYHERINREGHFRALVKRGKTYEAQGRHDKAAADYDTVRDAIKKGQFNLSSNIARHYMCNRQNNRFYE